MFGHVSRDGLAVDGDGKGGVDELLARRQPFLERVVLRVAELQAVAFLDVDRAGVGVDQLSGFLQDLLEQDVDVPCLGKLDPELDDGGQLLLLAQHAAFYRRLPRLSIGDSGASSVIYQLTRFFFFDIVPH